MTSNIPIGTETKQLADETYSLFHKEILYIMLVPFSGRTTLHIFFETVCGYVVGNFFSSGNC